MLAASRQQPAEKLCAGKHGLHVLWPKHPRKQSLSTTSYAEAVAEGGKLVLYHGGDTPTQQEYLHEVFQQRFSEINFTLIVDYSKYHDVHIDDQLETDTLVPDVVALQTLHDFTRWADEGKLLRYKPKGFSSIHPSLRDNDGAWMAYTIYSFYTSYNSSSLDGLAAPASMESLTDPQ
ncbi:putative ABC transporter [Phytophthora infestans]|uniref:Putative ABC transporter n=1 Tax=Phytophthora infestans TaxID=4787 RepID=A0A833TJ45_PHYIN|nr:putative ABC transporter [Phytophthora infestans]KAF4136774.1 putative ABC transporter [Phytophthora infestans]